MSRSINAPTLNYGQHLHLRNVLLKKKSRKNESGSLLSATVYMYVSLLNLNWLYIMLERQAIYIFTVLIYRKLILVGKHCIFVEIPLVASL